MSESHPSRTLADFAATLNYESIPAPVVRRAEDLVLDWFASALAGKGARPVESIARFAEPKCAWRMAARWRSTVKLRRARSALALATSAAS